MRCGLWLKYLFDVRFPGSNVRFWACNVHFLLRSKGSADMQSPVMKRMLRCSLFIHIRSQSLSTSVSFINLPMAVALAADTFYAPFLSHKAHMPY